MVSGIGMNGGYGNYGGYQQSVQSVGDNRRYGSVMQGLREKYGCRDCFEPGPYFARYEVPVQEVPKSVIFPTLMSRIRGFLHW